MLNKVTILLLSYNRLEDIKINIPNYIKMVLEHNLELIIVDNNSNDGSKEYIKNQVIKHPLIKLVLNNKNLGVAEGRNSGRKFASHEFVLHVDDDTYINTEQIEKLIKVMHQDKKIGALSPCVIHKFTKEIQNNHGNKIKEIINYHGACHLVRLEALKIVGEIDPKCSFGGEEIDYSIRLRKKGFKVLYVPTIQSEHNNIIRDDSIAFHRRKMRVYNFTRIYYKHFPLPLAMILSVRFLISHFISAFKIGIFLKTTIYFYCYIKGMIDGLINHQRTAWKISKKYFLNKF